MHDGHTDLAAGRFKKGPAKSVDEAMRTPSYVEIRSAESEIMKIIRDEHLEDRLSSVQHAI
jgi:hypothetical protein